MAITTFQSFKSRNFRLFFMGQSVSLLGTWMQKTAVSWVIYSITQSKFMLGVTVFTTLFPTAVCSMFGGITADRYNRYQVLLVTQILSLVQAVLLTLSVIFFEKGTVWAIIILSAVLGIINGFDVPARQSLVRDLVPNKTDLPNALALNSSMVNLAKFIGPALAGLVLELFGDQVCFAINAISFLAVIISLLLMKLPKPPFVKKAETNRIEELKNGFKYIKNDAVIYPIIIYVAIMGFFVLPFATLTPVFAKDIFQGNAATLGIIDGVIGLGAFIGALFLASLKKGAHLSKILVINTLIFGVGLSLFAKTPVFGIALICMAVAAFGMMSVRTLSNTMIQLQVADTYRGRVISIYVMVLTAMLPLGSLVVGSVSHYWGVQNTVLAQEIIAVLVALIFGKYLKKQKLKAKKKTKEPIMLENTTDVMLPRL